MAVRKSAEEKFVLSYFEKLNISPSRSNKQFWDILYRNHDKAILDEIRDMMRIRLNGTKEGKDLYNLKNDNLKLSLDFTRYSANLYRSYFDWLMLRKDFKPRRILDLGCDNGIVTCFYGLLYPEAEVVGIDICENAIKCGNELEEYFGLNNVTFKKLSIEELNNYYEEGYFDLITSVRTLHEVVDIPDFPRHWSYDELNYEVKSEKTSKILEVVKKILDTKEGRFITWDRMSDIETFVWWVKQLKGKGLFVDPKQSCKLRFFELDLKQMMPLLITSNECSENVDDVVIQRFYVEKILGEEIDFTLKDEYKDEAAEIAFKLIGDKELLFGLEIDYWDDSGRLRMESWKVEDALISYRYSNVGYRELSLYPLNMIEHAREELNRVKKVMEGENHKTFLYESIEERDRRNV